MYHAPVSLSGFRGLSDSALRNRVTAALDRLETVEPRIHAFLPEPDRRRRVLKDLEELFCRYPNPSSRPGLFGVPVGVKDIFRAEGLETRAGSLLPPETFAGPEAVSVTRLKNAGALILGKTVTTEFAYFHPGPTRNPWNLEHTPGGSSSGSAAAVSAGLCPLALGSQTIGSINRPAAFCGITGFKPSFGRVSREGVVPYSASADHVGLLAADTFSVRAAAEVLLDSWNPLPRPEEGQRKTILFLEDSYSAQASEEVLRAVSLTAQRLEDAGIRLKRVSFFKHIKEINDTHRRMTAREFADAHQRWFERYSDSYSEVSRELIYLGERIGNEELKHARAGRFLLREKVGALLSTEGAAALLTPASLSAAPRGLESTGSPLMNLPWTYAGVPTATLPAAVTPEGLPLGIQLVGDFGQDEELLELAGMTESLLPAGKEIL
ncbi:MAG: amidase [Spirochaetales bacterium]|nr:amidase [Spirochaetales bacterium]